MGIRCLLMFISFQVRYRAGTHKRRSRLEVQLIPTSADDSIFAVCLGVSWREHLRVHTRHVACDGGGDHR